MGISLIFYPDFSCCCITNTAICILLVLLAVGPISVPANCIFTGFEHSCVYHLPTKIQIPVGCKPASGSTLQQADASSSLRALSCVCSRPDSCSITKRAIPNLRTVCEPMVSLPGLQGWSFSAFDGTACNLALEHALAVSALREQQTAMQMYQGRKEGNSLIPGSQLG